MYVGTLTLALMLAVFGAVLLAIVLGNQLARATDLRDLTWQFTVVDSKEVNAFAVPGGFIYMNRGLIERATNMSQVAGVLGHEIGHVTMRHSIQQMQKAQVLVKTYANF